MKQLLLVSSIFLLLGSSANAQSKAQEEASRQVVPIISVPEATFQPVVTVTQSAPAAPSTRFRYQKLTLRGNSVGLLAPAWRGIVPLEPPKAKRDFLGNDKPGEVEALVMQTLNELIAEGWELVEVRNLVQPTGITQTTETKITPDKPNQPTYVSSISAGAYRETSYLLRRPLEE